ncbi:hypothetical protein D3C85_1199340 [compost metagenome]
MRFQLTQLDAETANFHLVIDAPQVFQRAVFAITRQVATAVQPRTRCGGKRIGDEALGAQARSLVITLGKAGVAADAQFADATGRQQMALAVQHIQCATRQRFTDGYADVVAGIGQRACVGTGHHRGFGRPVGVEQAHIAQTGGVPQLQAFQRHGFAADVDLTQAPLVPLRLRGPLLSQQEPVRRRQIRQGHALFDDLAIEGVGVPQLIAAHHQRRTHAQWRVALLDKAVEAERGELQHAVLRGEL